MTNDNFYIGYRKQMPPGVAVFLRGRVVVLMVIAAGLAVFLVAWQRPFAAGRFEFGVVKTFSGIVGEHPYPTLILQRPVADGGGGSLTLPATEMRSRYYLVAQGKHGAQDLVRGREGQRVTLKGSLIWRDDQTMIEVLADSVVGVDGTSAGAHDSVPSLALGTFTLRGEIVDSKCYLGVMKPGELKPHKACAIRCISGGCTPVLVVRDAGGLAAYFMLAGADGRAVNREVLGMVAEPLEITGVVERQDNLLVLKAEPGTYRRLE